ncbi:unnamed protein product [Penicillium nalgiovense]|nr:unnamed protein product [Penicillium nalgiovense]
MPERLHLQLLPIMSGSKQYLRSLMPSLSQVHGALVTLVTMPVGTRMLYGLAQEGHAPKLFTRLNRFGAPWISVAAVGSFLALGYMTLSSAASVVFDWLQQLFPWTSPFQPYAAWISPVSFSIIMLTGGFYVFIEGNWSPQTFVSSYFNIPFGFVLYFGYKFWRKTRLVTLEEIPIQEFLHIANEIPEPIPSPATGWRRLNILWA